MAGTGKHRDSHGTRFSGADLLNGADATLRPDKGYACVTIVIALAMMIGVLALAILAINVFPLQQGFALKSKVEIILSALALATWGRSRSPFCSRPGMTTGSASL